MGEVVLGIFSFMKTKSVNTESESSMSFAYALEKDLSNMAFHFSEESLGLI